jgi:iron complex transport system substrate-binding protein
MYPPSRIVCLTEETVETLYLLGEETRIVGISGYVVRPPAARRDKPRISSFLSADLPKILALAPDLVLAFSDLQAEIVAALIKAGVAVHCFNQRSVGEILDMIRLLGAMVGRQGAADALARRLEEGLRPPEAASRPKVYFEEWDEPMICGIGWVSELIEAAGGVDVFAGRRGGKAAKDRIVTAEEVIEAAPDIIIGSWCGKRFRPEKLGERPGFAAIPAVANNRLYEIKSPLILQPGPAALTDGFDALRRIIAQSG